MKSPSRPLNARRLPSKDLNWKAVLLYFGMGFSFLFGFAAFEAFDGVDKAGKAFEEGFAGDEGSDYVSVVPEDGFSFGLGEIIPVGFKPSGIADVEGAVAYFKR